MSEPIDISPSQRKELLALIQRHLPNVEVWAFGSRVKWTARSNSDLDLVAFAKAEDEARVSRLKEALEESSLPFRVDLLVWDNIPEDFKKNIRERYVVLVEAGTMERGQGTVSDYPVVRLGDYVDACLGKMLDAQKNRGKLRPYLGNSNVRWGSFILEDLAVMRFEDHEDERYGIRDGDLIVCEGGEPGRCAIWCGDAPMKIQKALHRVRTKDGLDNYFLYYWFLRAGSTGELEPFFTGTTIKHLTGKALAELRIPLPPITVQREVAKVLRSLDAKIDLNRRINQTLEAMAQAIFKSWFVDFDPVKAKIAALQEGRDPLRAAMSAISGKSDAELDALPPEQYAPLAATAELFPEEMEESELGEIPRGWAPAALATVCGLNTSSWSARTLPASVRYVDLANTKNGEVIDVQTMEGSNIPSRARRILEAGDTIVGTVRPGNRSFALVGEAGLTGSTGFAVLRPKNSYLREYVYLAATSDANIERLAHLADGGAYPAVRPEIVVSDVLPIPQDELLRDFHRISSYMFDHILANRRANRDLAELRDTLLPKLLSGELSVIDAMAEVEA